MKKIKELFKKINKYISINNKGYKPLKKCTCDLNMDSYCSICNE